MVFDSYKKILSNQDKSIFIVPSLHTKYSLLNYYEIDSPKNIRVVYSPLTKKTLLEPSNSISSVLNYRYLLLPSAGLWNKNPIRAIKAFTNAYKKLNDPNIRLVLTGAAILRDLPCFNPKTMIALDYVQDNDMQVLYANAYAIFYPSLNEGFGYPPLEGMKYGKPVLASAVTSITEICGDAALYFNPYDINEISNRILQIFLEVSLYLNLRFKSKSQYQFVSNKSDHLCQKLCQELVNS
jgi:glycosyltransferase involved in cell wall biosynthesis